METEVFFFFFLVAWNRQQFDICRKKKCLYACVVYSLSCRNLLKNSPGVQVRRDYQPTKYVFLLPFRLKISSSVILKHSFTVLCLRTVLCCEKLWLRVWVSLQLSVAFVASIWMSVCVCGLLCYVRNDYICRPFLHFYTVNVKTISFFSLCAAQISCFVLLSVKHGMYFVCFDSLFLNQTTKYLPISLYLSF